MPRSRPVPQALLCSLAFLYGAVRTHAESDTETVKTILRDWTARRDATKTFHYVAALGQIEKVVHGPTDVFGQPESPGSTVSDEAFTKMMTFSYDNGKIAFRLEGEGWSEERQAKVHYLFHNAFNGRDFIRRMGQAESFHGQIEHPNAPPLVLTNATDHMAIWLTFDPVGLLNRLGGDVEKMQIARRDVECDGRKCTEVLLPPGRARLFLDPARGYLLVRFVREGNGRIHSDLHMKYNHQKEHGWVLSEWVAKSFDSRGEISDERNFVVQECEVNTNLAKKLFEIDFSAGTKVSEVTPNGRRYFVSEGHGTLKPLSKEEFAAIPSGRP
jgi:hypothetical protein